MALLDLCGKDCGGDDSLPRYVVHAAKEETSQHEDRASSCLLRGA